MGNKGVINLEIMLSELKYENEKILENKDWNVIDVGKYNDFRVFYKIEPDRQGFDFIGK